MKLKPYICNRYISADTKRWSEWGQENMNNKHEQKDMDAWLLNDPKRPELPKCRQGGHIGDNSQCEITEL